MSLTEYDHITFNLCEKNDYLISVTPLLNTYGYCFMEKHFAFKHYYLFSINKVFRIVVDHQNMQTNITSTKMLSEIKLEK